MSTPNLPADTGRCVRCDHTIGQHSFWEQHKCLACRKCDHYLTVAQAALELFRELDEMTGEA